MTIPKETKILDDDEVWRLLEIMMAAMPVPLRKVVKTLNISNENTRCKLKLSDYK